MKAMVLERIAPVEDSPLKWSEVPAPEPGPGEVRLRVSCCAVCRTDLHVIEGDLPREKLPVIPGHQFVGRVDKQGPDCPTPPIGRRVGVAWLRHTCGQCECCQSGRENLCEESRYTGYQADGGYTEYAVVPADFAYDIPETFSDLDAAPLLCAGIVGYRAYKRANLPQGGILAIYGFGSSAHIILQIAKHRGARVHVISRGPEHLRLARHMGADWAGSNAAEMPDRAHSAIVFAPDGSLVPTALEHLRKGGTLSLAGIHMSPIPALDYDRLLFHERDVHPVTANTREDARELLAAAAEVPIRPRVTTYPLEEANRALQDLKRGRVSGTAVLTGL